MNSSLTRMFVTVALILGTCGAAYADTSADIRQVAHDTCIEMAKEMKALYTTRSISTPLLDKMHYDQLMDTASPVQSCESSLADGLAAR